MEQVPCLTPTTTPERQFDAIVDDAQERRESAGAWRDADGYPGCASGTSGQRTLTSLA